MLHTLRKTKAHIYLSYGQTFTNNLYAENIAATVDEAVTLSLDLNCNLRTRNKQTNTYIDAKDLADGQLARLESLQLDDPGVLQRLSQMFVGVDPLLHTWHLIVMLDGEHHFDVRPEYDTINKYASVTLHVISPRKKPK